MRKLSYVLAAATALTVVIPTVASAGDFSVRVGPDRGDYYRDRDYRGPRAGYDQDRTYNRGYHRGYDNDRPGVVIRTPGLRDY